jgi:hypothetical protein
MGRARPLNGLGQLFQLQGQSFELGGKETALVRGNGLRGVDQRVEHHGDARQDRFLDPLERLVEARLLVSQWHHVAIGQLWLSVGENGARMSNFSGGALAVAMIAGFLLLGGGVKLALDRQTRNRGILMIVAALVLVMNVMIWTV